MQPGIEVKLPKAITSKVLEQKNINIVISGENIIYVDSKVVNSKELRSILAEKSKYDFPVLIKADKRASLGKVVEVWDLCRELAITKVNIATNQE